MFLFSTQLQVFTGPIEINFKERFSFEKGSVGPGFSDLFATREKWDIRYVSSCFYWVFNVTEVKNKQDS